MKTNSTQDQCIINSIIESLMNLDSQSRIISSQDFLERSIQIKNILNNVEQKMGEEVFKQIFLETNKRLGHTIGPIHITIAQKLCNMGLSIKM